MLGKVLYFGILGVHSLVYAINVVDNLSTKDFAESNALALEFGKDYSALELEKLWTKSISLEHNVEPVIEVIGAPVASIEKRVSMTKRQHVSGYREQKAWLVMDSTCPVRKKDHIEFVVKVIYDTKNVLFGAVQNLDAFPKTTISGGRGRPLLSTAKFHHFACRPISKTTVCSYRYYGSIQAEIKYGRKDIGVSLLRSPLQAPYVMENCVSTFPGGPAIRCPDENDPSAVRCDLQEV